MRLLPVLLLLAACGGAEPPAPTAAPAPKAPPPPGAPASPADEAALAKAEAAAKQLGGSLKARVMEEMGKGGPTAAITVCTDEAPAAAARIQAETGVTVGRSSLRLRNPANAAPPWVQAWLAAQGERAAEGATPMSRVVDGKAQVLKPIAVEAPCLACHGPADGLAPEVKALLAEKYPADRATGYAAGDLRGALWAEVPVGG